MYSITVALLYNVIIHGKLKNNKYKANNNFALHLTFNSSIRKSFSTPEKTKNWQILGRFKFVTQLLHKIM